MADEASRIFQRLRNKLLMQISGISTRIRFKKYDLIKNLNLNDLFIEFIRILEKKNK
jgi:hypothetical protein